MKESFFLSNQISPNRDTAEHESQTVETLDFNAFNSEPLKLNESWPERWVLGEPTHPIGSKEFIYGNSEGEFQYVLAPIGYSMRQYYSHSTAEKGSGPGWDTRTALLSNPLFADYAFAPDQLPDVPVYDYEWVPANNERESR